MRRPQWPGFILPPAPRETEQFALPIVPSLLAQACESLDQREKRLKAVRRETARFFRAVASHLGEEKAGEFLQGFLSRPRGPGHPAGSTDPELDQELLVAYRERLSKAASEAAIRETPARVGNALAKKFRKRPSALTKRLNRLLNRQQAQRGKQQRKRALWESRFGRLPPLPPTLLSHAINPDNNSED
jgi:hypothetical protein